MLDVYRHMANRRGTNEAIELAHELSAWHDAMVKHRRKLARLGFDPDRHREAEDGAPADARELWQRAVAIFGEEASQLEFLRRSAEGVGEVPVS
jgi:hypothetical protein